jgi:hypothetical protein
MILFRNVGIAGNGQETTLLRKENDQGNAAYWYCRAGSLCAGNHSMWNLRASRETILVCSSDPQTSGNLAASYFSRSDSNVWLYTAMFPLLAVCHLEWVPGVYFCGFNFGRLI